MTVIEAYKKLIKTIPNISVIKCYEYETLFVFQTVSKKFKGTVEEAGKILNTLLSIDKNTGEIQGFNPLDISVKEYENGKEIKNFRS